jgi:TPR repeat protein
MATYQASDYETAARMFRTVAKQGDAWAQYNLGVMYDDGEGVPHDFGKAMKWYRMAAEHTHSADRKRVVPNTRPHEGVITRRGSTGQ